MRLLGIIGLTACISSIVALLYGLYLLDSVQALVDQERLRLIEERAEMVREHIDLERQHAATSQEARGIVDKRQLYQFAMERNRREDEAFARSRRKH